MKKFFVTAFAVLMLLGFIALGVYLVFIGNGVWTTEDGGEVGGSGVFLIKAALFVFLIAFPLFLLLWILFPKVFNKLLYKGVNKGIRGGARALEFKERCEEQNVPNITVNGINLPAVMAAADLVRDKVAGEEVPELADMEGLPVVCEQCGMVNKGTANFCSECGAELRK